MSQPWEIAAEYIAGGNTDGVDVSRVVADMLAEIAQLREGLNTARCVRCDQYVAPEDHDTHADICPSPNPRHVAEKAVVEAGKDWLVSGEGIMLNPHQCHPDYIKAATALANAIRSLPE